MKEFDVFVHNRPGELAKVCEMLGSQGVNIKAIASEHGGDRPLIRVVTDDEVTTKSTLSRQGISYEQRDVISVKMLDRPGELGKMARKLARGMVNVEAIYILGKESGTTEVAFTVDYPRKAAEILK